MICPNCRSEIGSQPVCPCCGTVYYRTDAGFEHASNKTLPVMPSHGYQTAETSAINEPVYDQRLATAELRSKLSLVLAGGSFVLQMIVLILLLYR